MKEKRQFIGFLGVACVFGLVFCIQKPAFAESSPIYYDTFYSDYYKSYPEARPVKKKVPAPQPTQQPKYYNGYDPYMQYQTTATYNQSSSPYNSFYQSVNHDTSKWEFEITYKKGEGQFMFENDVHSILNWDEMQTTEKFFSVSRDFMIKNRQYVFNFTYGSGSSSTTRTSDDDIFNEAHLISLGTGDAALRDLSLSIGMRNVYKWAGFELTPMIGYKRKKQKFQMSDHTAPAPFYLEYFCNNVGDYDICEGGINLKDHGLTASDLYYTNEEGEEISGTVTDADMFIPGSVTINGQIIDNLYYGMQIADEDFCYTAQSGNDVCLRAGTDGVNLLEAFGGVSSASTTEGITHMYYVTWEGPFVGLNMERMISNREMLHIYTELFKPSYKVWGNWPNRDDWAHDPSFIDDGGSAWGFSFDAKYKYLIKNSIALTLGVNYEYIKEKNADTTLFTSDGESYFFSDSILLARWKHYGVSIGVAFKL